MIDFYLIVFLDNQNLSIDPKIIFLGCLMPELLDTVYFGDYANLC